MSSKHSHNRFATVLTVLLTIYFNAFTGSAAAETVARLYSADGTVEAAEAVSPDWSPIHKNHEFQDRDSVRTGAQSRAGVRFVDGYLVRMNELTQIVFEGPQEKTSLPHLAINSGSSYFFSRSPRRYPLVKTPQVSAAIRGTEFVVSVTPQHTVISVLEGQLEASNKLGSILVNSGEQVVARLGAAPVKQIMVQPADAVEWAIYYPAILDLDDMAGFLEGASATQRTGWEALQRGATGSAAANFTGSDWRDVLGRSLIAYRQGDLQQAQSEIRTVPDPRPATLNLYHAALCLASGQVKQAETLLVQAEQSAAKTPARARKRIQAALLAQRSIIALVQNDKDHAKALAKQALQQRSDSPAATLAMSYVAQAHFDLEEARGWLQKTTDLVPKNVVAAARLAEIQLGFGERREALRTIDHALDRHPDNAYARTIQGFIELTRGNTDKAQHAFDTALRLDQSSALPRLGLGLVFIRKGDLPRGRRELEHAVQLDPLVSLYRSYLGKAYFEENREDLADREYTRALQLDPQDPTPYLYRSFLRLSTNRPVEALQDIEESIKRNDHRAVFRSALLLDQDQGVRSTSLGQAYRRLGFQQISRTEAFKAINRDYANPSAHFLLADAYSGFDQLDQAGISEMLIGRLLVPVNFNAILPGGGSDGSLNEYSTLFDRPMNRTRVSTTLESGRESIEGTAEATVARENFGFLLSYNPEYQRGFRENDWNRQHVLSLAGQNRLDEDTNLIWDGGFSAIDRGDVALNFDPRENDPDLDAEGRSGFGRLGFQHRFGPDSRSIGQVSFMHQKLTVDDKDLTGLIDSLNFISNNTVLNEETLTGLTLSDTNFVNRSQIWQGDLQHIFDFNLVSLVVGGGLLSTRDENDEEGILTGLDTGIAELDEVLGSDQFAFLTGTPLISTATTHQDSQRAYLYSTWHLSEWLDINAGVNFSNIELSSNTLIPPFIDDTINRDQWSPKAGFSVYATPRTTIRGAFFKSLGRSGSSDVVMIEPTFVGSFNQVFDDFPGSSQKFYGLGVDHAFTGGTYLGVDYQRRDVDQIVALGSRSLEVNLDQTALLDEINSYSGDLSVKERRVGAYLYQIMNHRLTATFDYTWYELEESLPGDPETETHRSTALLAYFAPSGLIAFSRATWRQQDREFTNLALTDGFDEDSNNFWIVDAGLGYQFPHRHGGVFLVFNNILDQSYRYALTRGEESLLPDFGATLKVDYNF